MGSAIERERAVARQSGSQGLREGRHCRRAPSVITTAAALAPFAALVAWLIGAAAVRADTVGSVTTTNAYVLRSAADTDQNEAQTIATKRLNDTNARLGYLRFDLADYVNTHGIGDITSVILRMTQTQGAADNIRVWGLLESAANGAVTEANWEETITWNTQPTGALANSAAALPSAATTATLATVAVDGTLNVTKDIALSLNDFQTFLMTDTDRRITLLYTNNANNNMSWASRANTNTLAPPTLVLEGTPSIPEPATPALIALTAAIVASLRRRRQP